MPRDAHTYSSEQSLSAHWEQQQLETEGIALTPVQYRQDMQLQIAHYHIDNGGKARRNAADVWQARYKMMTMNYDDDNDG